MNKLFHKLSPPALAFIVVQDKLKWFVIESFQLNWQSKLFVNYFKKAAENKALENGFARGIFFKKVSTNCELETWLEALSKTSVLLTIWILKSFQWALFLKQMFARKKTHFILLFKF